MGGFCVFGISKTACRKKAERSTSEYIPGGGGKTYTVQEWGDIVRAKADEEFATRNKRERISPELDAPQFCRDWMATQPSEHRQSVIMCRGEKVDKHGVVVKRNGKPVMTWLEYDEKEVR